MSGGTNERTNERTRRHRNKMSAGVEDITRTIEMVQTTIYDWSTQGQGSQSVVDGLTVW